MVKRFFRLSTMTVTVAYMVINLVVLTLFTIPVLYAWHEIVEKRSTERLDEDIQRLAKIYEKHGRQDLSDVIEIMAEGQPAEDERFILLADASYRPIAGNLAKWPDGLPPEPGVHPLTFQYSAHPVHAILVSRRLKDGPILVVGRNTAKSDTVKNLFWWGFAAASGVIVLLGLTGRWIIRSALLGEINRISATAQAIVTGDLSRRLHKNQDSELDFLVDIVNRMLDQIEQLINGNLHVSDAIAHDLRTPLTELRIRLEALTLSQHPADQVHSEIDAAIVDVDRVILIFNALLRLAEIDHNARYAGFEQVDVVQVAEDVVDFYRPLAELRGIELNFTADQRIATQGDSPLLAQAIGNLIDNALKYTHSKVVIEVIDHRAFNRISICISDDGPGISDEEKPRVTKKFYRSHSSRGTSGVGLGLSLVAAVAKLHGGTLELSDADPGLKVTLLIPRTSAKFA